MGKKDRGKVWLAAGGLVVHEGNWLLVQKKYGGLKGKWSIPAGFVEPNETVDEAAVREVLEETGIESEVIGLLGIRTGVIRNEVSDNMIVFLLKKTGGALKVPHHEIEKAAFLSPDTLKSDPESSLMIHYFLKEKEGLMNDKIDPGEIFGYTSYKLFDIR